MYIYIYISNQADDDNNELGPVLPPPPPPRGAIVTHIVSNVTQ